VTSPRTEIQHVEHRSDPELDPIGEAQLRLDRRAALIRGRRSESTFRSDCVFCRVAAGDEPVSFVHRDELVCAFMDSRPVTPGHLLVIPNQHVVNTYDLAEATADHLFAIGRRLARALRRTDAIRSHGTNFSPPMARPSRPSSTRICTSSRASEAMASSLVPCRGARRNRAASG